MLKKFRKIAPAVLLILPFILLSLYALQEAKSIKPLPKTITLQNKSYERVPEDLTLLDPKTIRFVVTLRDPKTQQKLRVFALRKTSGLPEEVFVKAKKPFSFLKNLFARYRKNFYRAPPTLHKD